MVKKALGIGGIVARRMRSSVPCRPINSSAVTPGNSRTFVIAGAYLHLGWPGALGY